MIEGALGGGQLTAQVGQVAFADEALEDRPLRLQAAEFFERAFQTGLLWKPGIGPGSCTSFSPSAPPRRHPLARLLDVTFGQANLTDQIVQFLLVFAAFGQRGKSTENGSARGSAGSDLNPVYFSRSISAMIAATSARAIEVLVILLQKSNNPDRL